MEIGLPYKNRDQQRAYQREWIARRKAEWFADKVCADCGSTSNLELDHIDPSQKVSHRVWGWGQARREAELAKCQPLCESCHQRKTSDYLSNLYWQPELHGRTDTQIFKKGCHCEQCEPLRQRAVVLHVGNPKAA